MTPLLTEAEREALNLATLVANAGDRPPILEGGAEGCYFMTRREASNALVTLASTVTRLSALLSARAVPVETVAWITADPHPTTCSDWEMPLLYEHIKAKHTIPLILRSAAEADKARVVALLARCADAMEWSARCMSERRTLEGAMNGVDFQPTKLEYDLRERVTEARALIGKGEAL